MIEHVKILICRAVKTSKIYKDYIEFFATRTIPGQWIDINSMPVEVNK